MFGIWRRGVAVVVPAVVTLVLASPARAGEMDDHMRSRVAQVTGEQAPLATDAEKQARPAAVTEGTRVLAADYHPETDRWTERNNRIKLSLLTGGMIFSGEMRINAIATSGLRLSWEVPGFIGIRLDSVFSVPDAKLRVRNVDALPSDPVSGQRIAGDRRRVKGYVNCTSLSIAIFNPELSVASNLVMWAGFGIDVWTYRFHQQLDPPPNGPRKRYEYDDMNIGGNIFFDLQYRVVDVFHIGIGLREHVIYSRQTRTGLFYDVQGVRQGSAAAGGVNSRRESPFNSTPLSLATEIQISFSVLF